MKKLFCLVLLVQFCTACSFGQYHINYVLRTDTLSHPYCDTAQFYINSNWYACACSTNVMKAYFGDGDAGYASVNTSGEAIISHYYRNPGYYTAKFYIDSLAYPSGTDQFFDSAHITVDFPSCSTLHTGIYFDMNSNGVYDACDRPNIHPARIQVSRNGTPVDTIAGTSGFYFNAYFVPGDVYSFRVISLSPGLMVTSPASGIIYDTIGSSPNFNVKNFGLQCSGSSGYDLQVYAVIPVTGVHDQWGNIYVSNAMCNPTNATVTMHFSPKYSTPVCVPSAASAYGNTLVWNVTGLSTEYQTGLYYAIWNFAGSVAVNDTTHTDITITPTTGDGNPADNVCIVWDTVSASCDPNEMWVAPAGIISSGTKLKYTVNFENTGNDTAFNIYVLDTLSDNVDVKSLDIVMATAPMHISELTSGTHNILKFDFPDINLLDSSHHGKCDGAVIFTVNSKAGLPNGTIIDNRAGIYFDYNPVVMTNTVENVIGIPSSVAPVNNTTKVEVYPNPAAGKLMVKTNGMDLSQLLISNVFGQPLISQQIAGGVTSVDISALPAGMYYMTLKGNSGVSVQRFEKL